MQKLVVIFILLFSYSFPAISEPIQNTRIPSYLRGVIVPMITPYKGGKAQKLDLKALERLTDYLCKTKTSAIFPVSGFGQWRHLTTKEKIQVIKTTIKAAKGRKPVLAGIGFSEDLKETTIVLKSAEENNATAIMAVTPSPHNKNQQTILNYYSQICSLTSLPLILYDRKAELEPATFSLLLDSCPNIIGIKYREKKNMDRMAAIVKAANNRAAVLSGSEKVTIPAMKVGAVGIIGSGANVYPNHLYELTELGFQKKWKEAHYTQKKINIANGLMEELGGGAQGAKKILNDIIGVKMSTENRGDTFRPEKYPGHYDEIYKHFSNMNLPPARRSSE